MKKNILLYGSSRSGKTTLSKLISQKLGYNIVSLDSIVSAFSRALPQLNINHDNADGSAVHKFKPFLWEYINTINKSNNKKREIFYCVEGSYYDINDLYTKQDNFITIILAENFEYPKQYFNQMKEFDKEYDWTYKQPDEKLMIYAHNLYKDNKRIIDFCKKHNMKFYDTSKNREKVFRQIIDDIENEINLTEDDYLEQVVLKYGELKVLLKSPTYLIKTITKRYKSMISISQDLDYDYSLEYGRQPKNIDLELFEFSIPHMEYRPKFTIDNDSRCSKVFFLDVKDKDTKKRIARNFITNLFIRLYQLKGALLLHCACVEKNNKAIIIIGKANSGKTVSMLNLLDFGFNFITNDFLIVDKNRDELEFLPFPQFVGIRRVGNWLELDRNKKYRSLKSEGYTKVTEDRIFISPHDLINLNNVSIGNIYSQLKVVVIPQYAPDQPFSCYLVDKNKKLEVLKNNIFNNFIDYSSQENFDNDFYKINVNIRNANEKSQILNDVLNKKTFLIKQNETNIEKVTEFIIKQLED